MSIIQGPVPVAPCQTLISRFATFASLYPLAGLGVAAEVVTALARVDHAAGLCALSNAAMLAASTDASSDLSTLTVSLGAAWGPPHAGTVSRKSAGASGVASGCGLVAIVGAGSWP